MKENPQQATRLLIVDDHQILIDGLFNMLDQSCYQIIDQAHNAEEALKIIENTEIDLMVCDLEMPGMPGLELIRIIKKKYPHIKILVLSMHDEKSIVTEAVKLGINGYMLKNISQNKLIHALDRARNDKFYISERTVESHRKNIFRKTNTKSLVGLIKYTIDNNLI